VTIDVRPVSRLSARDDICAKFRESAAVVLAPPAIARLEDSILALEHLPDIADLMNATTRTTSIAT